MKNADFVERLNITFNYRKLSEVSRELGISDATLRNYFKGRIPVPEALMRIAQVTGVSLNWLLMGQGDMYVGKPTPPMDLGKFFELKIGEIIDKKFNERMDGDIEGETEGADDAGEVRSEFDTDTEPGPEWGPERGPEQDHVEADEPAESWEQELGAVQEPAPVHETELEEQPEIDPEPEPVHDTEREQQPETAREPELAGESGDDEV